MPLDLRYTYHRLGEFFIGRCMANLGGLNQNATRESVSKVIAGRYRIISQLGAGGMGVAYRAWDHRSERPVVVKLPSREVLMRQAGPERFRREIFSMLILAEHPSVVPVIDHCQSDPDPFVAMRFLPGGSLQDRQRKDTARVLQAMQPKTLWLWLPDVASALDFIHSKGVVHRDIKPANFFFDGLWRVFVGDFGIAKFMGESDDQDGGSWDPRTFGEISSQWTITTGGQLGTLAYMAPEQFEKNQDVNGRVDQYALAVTIYEWLAGSRPFTAKESQALMRQHRVSAPPPLPQQQWEIPTSLRQALERALSKNPQDRFSTCAELCQALLADIPLFTDDKNVARLLCPQCKTILKLPSAARGQRGKCTRCLTPMVVADDLGALWLVGESHGGTH